jgi:hypothetical protein
MLVLAQSQGSSSQAFEAAMWALALIVLVLLGSLGVVFLRRKVLSKDGGGTEVITMSDLRTMRDSGQLSQEEYDTMRAKMAKKVSESASKDPKIQAQLEQLRGARKNKQQGSGGAGKDAPQ